MTSTSQSPAPETVRQAFDEPRRAQVLMLLKLGCSRRLAAEMAGCAHTTIARTALRDPVFAAQLADAESHVDIAALKRVQEAAAENKNWRAAAWILERRHPEEFGRRAAHTFGGDRVMALLAQVFDFTLPLVKPDKRDNFLLAFNATMHEVEAEMPRGNRGRHSAAAPDKGESSKAACYRSPYEHPQWYDPDRLEARPEEDEELIAWANSLSEEEIEEVAEFCRRDEEARRNGSDANAGDCPDFCGAPRGTRAAGRREGENATVPFATTDDDADREQVVAPIADQPMANGDVPASVRAPVASVEVVESVDTPAVQERPAQASATQNAEHQSYQEWAAQQSVIVRHNILRAQALRLRSADAPRSVDSGGGAEEHYQQRLKAWTEALAR